MVSYIKFIIEFVNGDSMELNTSDYSDVYALCDILKTKCIPLEDAINNIGLLRLCKDNNVNFYNAMQYKSEDIAKKYG